MRTVSWITKSGKRSRTHGISYYSLDVTSCGKRVSKNGVVYGSANRPTEEEKRMVCAKCWS